MHLFPTEKWGDAVSSRPTTPGPDSGPPAHGGCRYVQGAIVWTTFLSTVVSNAGNTDSSKGAVVELYP